jgi:hypothetical protein
MTGRFFGLLIASDPAAVVSVRCVRMADFRNHSQRLEA